MDSHHHHWHFFSHKELGELYLSVSLRAFAISMVLIFIPLYLLKIGYSLASVFLFFICLHLGHILGVIPATKIASKKGFKHVILFSMPLLITALLMLMSIEQYSWPLWIIGAVYGFSSALFWMGYHIDFAKFSSKKKRGTEVGTVRAMVMVFSALGPIIGGAVVTIFGFQIMFILVAGLLLFAAVPLFFSEEVHDETDCSVSLAFKGQSWRNFFSFFGRGLEHGAAMVIWPILVFYSILGSYAGIGALRTATFVAAIVFSLIIGKISNTHRSLTLRIGSALNALVWIGRAFVGTTFGAFMTDTAYGATATMVLIPFEAKSYDKASKRNVVHFMIFREMSINFGLVFFYLCMIALSDLTASLFFGGGANLLYLLF